MERPEKISHQKKDKPTSMNKHVEFQEIIQLPSDQTNNQNIQHNKQNSNTTEAVSSLKLFDSFNDHNALSRTSISLEQPYKPELQNIQPAYNSTKSMTIPITHIQSMYQPPMRIPEDQSSPQKLGATTEDDLFEQPPRLRRLSMSSSTKRHNWIVEVKHVIRQQPERERDEAQQNQQNQQNADVNQSASSTSQCGDESDLNRQIEQNHLDTVAFKKRMTSFEEPEGSNDSEIDKEEENCRREELLRLAEENKLRLSKQLEDFKQLKEELDDETPFGQRIFVSMLVSAVIGGGTVLITKNKRSSVIASLMALALTLIIQ